MKCPLSYRQILYRLVVNMQACYHLSGISDRDELILISVEFLQNCLL